MEINPQAFDSAIADLKAALAKLEALAKPGPVVITDPAIPQPPSDALHTRDFPGDDLGAKLNAADERLGDREGSIVIDEPGSIATQVRLRPRRSLYFSAGEFPIINPADNSRLWFGGSLIDHHSKVFGVGPNTRFIEPADHGWIVFQAAQDAVSVRGTINTLVTEDLEFGHFDIVGANTRAEGGVRSTIQPGNVHGFKAHHIGLLNTSCLGIAAGGNAQDGHHAEDFIVSKCRYVGVASQGLSAVNAIRFLFEDNDFIDSGKFLNQGMTPIDLEPNDSADLIQGVVRNNRITSAKSPLLHGNGILAQNGVGTQGYNVVIEGNSVRGGGNVATGIYVAGQYRTKDTNEPVSVEFARANPDKIRINAVENVVVRDNDVSGVIHSLYRFEVGHNLLVEGNKGTSRGVGGSETTEVDIFDVERSQFKGFRLKIDPPNPSAKLRMYERGTSKENTFEDNDGLEAERKS